MRELYRLQGFRDALASKDVVADIVREVLNQQQPAPLRVGPKEICKRLGIGRMTLWRWMELPRPRIPYERHGRKVLFDIAAVEAALKKFRIKAAGE